MRTDRPVYRCGSDSLLTVTIENTGRRDLFVDPATPVWKQTSLHFAGPRSGMSFRDVSAPRGGLRVAPGGSFTFAPADRGGSRLSRWTGLKIGAPGKYLLDATYSGVDGPTIAFVVR